MRNFLLNRVKRSDEEIDFLNDSQDAILFQLANFFC